MGSGWDRARECPESPNPGLSQPRGHSEREGAAAPALAEAPMCPRSPGWADRTPRGLHIPAVPAPSPPVPPCSSPASASAAPPARRGASPPSAAAPPAACGDPPAASPAAAWPSPPSPATAPAWQLQGGARARGSHPRTAPRWDAAPQGPGEPRYHGGAAWRWPRHGAERLPGCTGSAASWRGEAREEFGQGQKGAREPAEPLGGNNGGMRVERARGAGGPTGGAGAPPPRAAA